MNRVSPWRRGTAEAAARLRGWPRLVAAAACLALAGSTALGARDRPDPEASVPVVVAGRALSAGTVLRAADLRTANWRARDSPPAALHQLHTVVGSVLAGALTDGEPITRARLRGPGLATGLAPATVAVTVVLDNPANATIISAGDVVDLLLVTEADPAQPTVPPARVLARAVRVLAALPADDRLAAHGATLVVAADTATASRLAAVSGRAVVATLRAPP